MLPLWVTKAVVLVLMAVLTLAACFSPILVRRMAEKALKQDVMQMFMSLCLCFGAGVLLATVFLHLLPETRLAFERADSLGYLPALAYPMTELSICMGFFFIYLVEEAVHSCLGHGQDLAGLESGDNNIGHSHMGHIKAKPAPTKPNPKETDVDAASLERFLPDSEAGAIVASGGGQVNVATFRSIMVVFALSLHSILEGLALGLVKSSLDAWVLFAALSAHKLIIAFCMGMELLAVGVSKIAFFTSLTIFSVASPLGGLAGTLLVSFVTQTNAVGVLVPTVLHGLSGGTLLYVTFCEILERERAKPGHPTTKMVGLLSGFFLMAVLQVVDVMYSPVEEPIGARHDEDSSLASFASTQFPVYNPIPAPYTVDPFE